MFPQKYRRYINLALIIIIILILFLIGFYMYWNKEAKIGVKQSSKTEEIVKIKLLCQEQKMECLRGGMCVLSFCFGPVSIEDIKNEFISEESSDTEPSSPGDNPDQPSDPDEPIEPYMDSDNYAIAWDSINIGGGYSTSESYVAEDTVGEIATGYSTSENYITHAGYQQSDEEAEYISLEVDYATVVLTTGGNGIGDFLDGITGGTVTAYNTWTVTTNSTNGYTLALKQTNGAKSGGGTDGALTDVSDTNYEFLPISAIIPTIWPTLSAGETGFGYSLSSLTGNATPASDWSGKTDGTYFVKVGTSDYNLLDNSGVSDPSGDGLRVNWKAQFVTGGSQYLKAGTYKEFVTVTATTK